MAFGRAALRHLFSPAAASCRVPGRMAGLVANAPGQLPSAPGGLPHLPQALINAAQSEGFAVWQILVVLFAAWEAGATPASVTDRAARHGIDTEGLATICQLLTTFCGFQTTG